MLLDNEDDENPENVNSEVPSSCKESKEKDDSKDVSNQEMAKVKSVETPVNIDLIPSANDSNDGSGGQRTVSISQVFSSVIGEPFSNC